MSTSAAASSASSAASGTSGSTTTTKSNALGKDAFLQLLVTQLKNQDPMNPTDSTQYVAELAQFSSLESTQNIQSDLESEMQSQPMFQGSSLVGRTVTATDPTTGTTYNGTVDSVKFSSTQTTISVGGKDVPLSYVTSMK